VLVCLAFLAVEAALSVCCFFRLHLFLAVVVFSSVLYALLVGPAVWNSLPDPIRNARGGKSRLAAWHLPRGPVGLPARWADTSNVEVGHSHKQEEGKMDWNRGGSDGPYLKKGGGLYLEISAGATEFLVVTLLIGPVCQLSQGQFEELVRPAQRERPHVCSEPPDTDIFCSHGEGKGKGI